MRIEHIKIYLFDELSEKAKENAISNMRDVIDTYVLEKESEKTLQEFENIFPIKVKEFGYEYNPYVYFDFREKDWQHGTIKDLSGQRLATYIWNNFKDRIYKGKYYSIGHCNKETGKYNYKSRYSKILLDNCCPLTGYCADDDILEPIFSFMKKPDNRNFYELMSDCLKNWVKRYADDYEYATSDEGITESIKTNQDEFLENGELYDKTFCQFN